MDAKRQCARIFVSNFIDIIGNHVPIPHWAAATQTQWAQAIGITAPHKPNALPKWLSSVTTHRGPQGMEPFWKDLLA